ncbi:MAG: glycosyltransferase family 87 protein [Acetobacteraceae bacterium]|nr:glycosyltransferase family 87 protein [Acetobacteraceae bacterium]
MVDRGIATLLVGCCLLLDVVLFLLPIRQHGAGFFSYPSDQLLHDFAYFWGGARLFWIGSLDRVFDPDSFNAWLATQLAPGSMQAFATWSYPPTMLLLLLPFGLLPLPVAFIVWLGATFAFLGLVLRSAVADRRVALIVLLSPAAFYSLTYGQNGALTAGLLIAAIWCVDRRPILAGACAGLLIIKPQLGILLPFAFAAGGYRRAFAAAALVSVAMIAATVVVFGPQAWIGFVTQSMPRMTAQLLHEYGIPPQYAMPTMWVTLQGWGADRRLATIGQSLSALVAIVLVVRAWSLPHADRRWRNALTCVLPLLATPFGYVYDATPAMLAVAVLAQAGFSTGFAWPERAALAGLWMWPALAITWSFYLGLHPIGGFLLLAVALCLAWRIERSAITRAALLRGMQATAR